MATKVTTDLPIHPDQLSDLLPEELEVIELWRRARHAIRYRNFSEVDGFLQKAKDIIGEKDDY